MMCSKPTTQRRLAAQERCAASCPLSDMSDVDSDYLSQPDVDDHQPAMIELVSCDSSFSDCSVPYHELITVSPATQLPTGLVKVRKTLHHSFLVGCVVVVMNLLLAVGSYRNCKTDFRLGSLIGAISDLNGHSDL